jgi:hypothetical protein
MDPDAVQETEGQQGMALEEFLTSHRAEVIALARAKIAQRVSARPTDVELDEGIPLL